MAGQYQHSQEEAPCWRFFTTILSLIACGVIFAGCGVTAVYSYMVVFDSQDYQVLRMPMCGDGSGFGQCAEEVKK